VDCSRLRALSRRTNNRGVKANRRGGGSATR
jgi:hypothetical protein